MKTRHKKTCGVCGFPREHHLVGIPYTPCEDHCPGCRQPLPGGGIPCVWCCPNCSAFPCSCAPVIEEIEDGEGDYDYGGGDYWEFCGDDDCEICINHCNDHYCEACPTHVIAKANKSGKVIPEGKVYTGKGKSGYATNQLTPGWEAAGVKQFPFSKAEALYDTAEEAWPDMRCDEVDPVQRAADFYCLSAVTSRMLNTGAGRNGLGTQQVLGWYPEYSGAFMEADVKLAELIDDTDRSFCAYIDMACGGELRHHPNVGHKHLSSNRAAAWVAWRSLREVRGTEALMDAFWLFNDFTQGGYGGPLWAGAAQLLHKRLTGQITKAVFVDQTFSLVHNGGVFLNKKHWKIKGGKQLDYLQKYLLPAQARDDWQTMLDVASTDTRRLWREGWMDMNRARRKAGAPCTPVPGLASNHVRRCAVCGMNPTLGHRSFECKDGNQVERVERRYAKNSGYSYQFPSWSSDGKTLKLYEGKYYSSWTSQRTTATRSFGGVLKAVLDEEREWKGHSRLMFNDLVIWEFNLAKPAKWCLRDLLDIHGVRVEYVPNPNEEDDEVPWSPSGTFYVEDDDDSWYDDDDF